MTHQRTARRVGAFLVLVGALTLTGCASGDGPVEDFPGVPMIEVIVVEETVEEGEGEGGAEEEVAVEEGEAFELEELEVPEGEIAAVYLEDGGQIAIVLWGSSTCPPVGTRLTVLEDADSGNAVRIDLAEIPADRPCTQDLVPHTTVFPTSSYTTTTQPLRIEVDGEEVILPIK